MATKTELIPEVVRKMMLKNTVIMDTYNKQIQENMSQLTELLEEFKETITNES